jgi:hypothetical protein
VNGTCDGNEYINSYSQWNTSECTDAGGVASPHPQAASNSYYNRYAPTCTIDLATINTSSGEALLIYQWDSFYLETTCGGVAESASWSQNYGKEYYVTTGAAMDCSHRLYTTIGYDDQNYYLQNQPQNEDLGIWSIVYAIQDVIVVE